MHLVPKQMLAQSHPMVRFDSHHSHHGLGISPSPVGKWAEGSRLCGVSCLMSQLHLVDDTLEDLGGKHSVIKSELGRSEHPTFNNSFPVFSLRIQIK